MIDRQHDLPITKQAEILRISRGSVYYLPRPVPEADLAIMRRLDRDCQLVDLAGEQRIGHLPFLVLGCCELHSQKEPQLKVGAFEPQPSVYQN